MQYLQAFLCGGVLCAIGQLLIDKTRLTPARILTSYVVAGVILGAVIVAAVRGSAPPPPTPGLCWYWFDAYQQNGYWDRCGAY